MISRITNSLSARLLGVFLITSIIYAFASRYAVNVVLDRDYLRDIAGAHIALHTNYVLEDLGYPPDIRRAEAITRDNPFDIRIDGPDVNWTSSEGFPDESEIPFEPNEFVQRLKASDSDSSAWLPTLQKVAFARYDRHSYVRIEQGEYNILLSSPKIATTPPPNLTWPIIGLVSVLLLGGCYLVVRWLVKPIQWIKEGADRIGQGDLDYRIPVRRRDDLGELTTEINEMANDVQEMLEAKRQLLLAISHELRSPLTRTKVALEFLEDQQTRASILEDVEEMEQLINDLLEGERLNTRHSKLQIAEVDLAALLRDLVAGDFNDVAARIQLDLPETPLELQADHTRIRLLVKNLVSNALCYTPDDAPPIRLALASAGSDAVITVEDQGSGMSEADVARATEPFYRADPARCRDTGGFGLGLYLCRRIAEAHGGRLEIDSTAGQGTTVRVRLPQQAEVQAAA
jgi:signal transduction histidine kinase